MTCHYTVVDVNVQVVVQQTYTSHMSEAQDISYTFPLPSDAAVCAFTAVVDGRTVRGVVKRKAEAKAEYNAAIAEGKTAALLEEHRAEGRQSSGEEPRRADGCLSLSDQSRKPAGWGYRPNQVRFLIPILGRDI